MLLFQQGLHKEFALVIKSVNTGGQWCCKHKIFPIIFCSQLHQEKNNAVEDIYFSYTVPHCLSTSHRVCAYVRRGNHRLVRLHFSKWGRGWK